MKIQTPSIEESLRTELRSWLCCALADVLALPTSSVVHATDRATVATLLARTRATIDAVRLYASEYDEVCPSHALSHADRRFADLATEMCSLLEEEVIQLEQGFLMYAS